MNNELHKYEKVLILSRIILIYIGYSNGKFINLWWYKWNVKQILKD